MKSRKKEFSLALVRFHYVNGVEKGHADVHAAGIFLDGLFDEFADFSE